MPCALVCEARSEPARSTRCRDAMRMPLSFKGEEEESEGRALLSPVFSSSVPLPPSPSLAVLSLLVQPLSFAVLDFELEVLFLTFGMDLMVILRMVWDRLLVAFMLVDPTWRCAVSTSTRKGTEIERGKISREYAKHLKMKSCAPPSTGRATGKTEGAQHKRVCKDSPAKQQENRRAIHDEKR